jgi:hypothetical protein
MDETTKLQTKYEKFTKLLTTSTGETCEALSSMLDSLGERIILTPGSLTDQESWTHPGGLIEYSMSVTKMMSVMSKTLGLEIEPESIIKVGLLHAIGMIGGPLPDQDFLIPQDSDWHRKQGRAYRFNEKLPKMPVAHRSLLILQNFGVKLSYEEWVAIATYSGPSREENRFYIGSEPQLSVLLSTSRQWIISQKNT